MGEVFTRVPINRKKIQKPAPRTPRPICSSLSLRPPGVEGSRPVAGLRGQWHRPSLAGAGPAQQARAARRQAVGGLEAGEPCRGAAPRPAQSRQPHSPQTTCPVSLGPPGACLWPSCLVASPSAGAGLPPGQGTARKGSSALCLTGGAPDGGGGQARLGSLNLAPAPAREPPAHQKSGHKS